MKLSRLIAASVGALWALTAFGQQIFSTPYGVQNEFPFVIPSSDGLSFDVDESDDGNDAIVLCNAGTEAESTNTYTDEGSSYNIILSATELQCETVTVLIDEAVDTWFYIETFGDVTSARNQAIPLTDFGTNGGLPILDANGNVQADVEAFDDDASSASGTVTLPNATLASTTNITGGTITTVSTLTGHTPQTGDSFARLGAPAGASLAADIVVLDNFVDDLETRVGTPGNLGGGTSTVAGNLADIEAQTDDIGAAGAGLTVLATQASVTAVDDFVDGEITTLLSQTSAATLQSEANDALVALELDQLLSTTYNPAAEPASDSLFGDLTESDGGVTRFTTNSLEQAPTGGADSIQGPAFTTVATAPSTTTVTLTAAPTSDTQLPGFGIYIEDNGAAGSYCLRKVTSVASGVVTYDAACPFTVAAADVVKLLPAFLDEGVSVAAMEATALADLFTVDSGETSASTVPGSVVEEIGDLAAGGGVTEAGLAAAVWNRDATGHQTLGTFGQAIGDPVADTDTIFAKVNEIEDETDDIGAAGAGLTAADDTVVGLVDDIGVAGAGLSAIPDQTINLTGTWTGSVTGSVGSVSGAVGSVTGAVGSVTGLTASDVAAIKAKTDSLTFTVAGNVDANVQRVNDVTITGNGGASPFAVSLRSLRRQMRAQGVQISTKSLRELRNGLIRDNGAPQSIQVAL